MIRDLVAVILYWVAVLFVATALLSLLDRLSCNTF